jgi:hypothetical protein
MPWINNGFYGHLEMRGIASHQVQVVGPVSLVKAEFDHDGLDELHCLSFRKQVRASSSLEEDREAGANPALPRNCKRGHSTGPLE